MKNTSQHRTPAGDPRAIAAQEAAANRISSLTIPGHVMIISLADRDAVVVHAYYQGITAAASTKREPGDKPDAAIGADLATARALALLARKLERRARGAVRHAEHVKADRAARKTREDAATLIGLLNPGSEPVSQRTPSRGPRVPARKYEGGN
jgi:hypothetical protein